MTDQKAKRDIRNLLVLLGFGMMAAFLIAGLFLYKYGPSGTYLAKNVILSPEVIPQLNYNAYDSISGGSSRFILKGIEFAFYDKAKKQWVKMNLGVDDFAKFYALVANDQSMENAPEEIQNLFGQEGGKPSTITLLVKTESDQGWQAESRIFQEIAFSNEGNYYKILLREQSAKDQWAYFKHSNIFQHVQQLFIPTP